MKTEFTEILVNEFDCLEGDLDIIIKQEGNRDAVFRCMIKALTVKDTIVFNFLTADGHTINVNKDKVLYYMPYHTDEFPCIGFLEYNFDLELWTPNGSNVNVPVYKTREGIDEYIKNRQ